MCCDETNNCIGDLLRRIALIQKQDCDNNRPTGCDKPFLGPIRTVECYNTRPVTLYNCCTGGPWSFSYSIDGVAGTSNVFRVEAVDDNCCTCRILATDATTGEYTNTNEFFTINLDCVGAVRCLPDTYIDLC